MTKVRTVIMSHLNDIKYEISAPSAVDRETILLRVKLIERLVFDCPDTTVYISDEQLEKINGGLP
jgi:hypothetical protein